MWIAKKDCINMICNNGVALAHQERLRRNAPKEKRLFFLHFYPRSQKDAMVIALINACMAASLHVPYVSKIQFSGMVTQKEKEFIVSNMGICAYCGNDKRFFHLAFLSILRVPKHSKDPEEEGFLPLIAVEAMDAAGDFFIKEVLDFSARGSWRGLVSANNKYGFSADYTGGRSNQYQFDFFKKQSYTIEEIDPEGKDVGYE